MEVTVCAVDEADAQLRAEAKVGILSCGDLPPIDTCPYVMDLRILDPDTDEPKSEFLKGDRIKFEIQALNPGPVEHVMNVKIYMDNDPDDAIPPVVSNQQIVIPAYSYKTGQYVSATPDSLPTGRIYVSAALIDDSCSRQTEYLNSFRLGVDETPPLVGIVDGGIYATDNTSIFADWWGDDPESEILYYTYRIGTGPCLGDVVDWTVSAVAGPRDIPVSLPYDDTYYVCVKAMNSRGLESEPVSTDGITVLDPLVDHDNDGFSPGRRSAR